MFFKYTKWALLWAVLIFILCAIPGRDLPHISFLEILEFDKWVHAGVFFVLTVLFIRGFSLQNSLAILKSRPMIASFVISVAYGGSLELMQEALFSERSADIYDFIANSFGCVMGLLLYRWTERKFLAKFIA